MTHATPPTTDVHVRRLTPGDEALAQRLVALLAKVFQEEDGEPLPDAYVADLLARPEFWAVAALVGDTVVGGLTAHALPMTRTQAAELFIYDLAVRADWQRRGVGRRLLETLLAEAASAGIHAAFVSADDEDAHALDFYRALGGAPSPVTIFTFGTPGA